jgi:hypothetical protein
MTRNRTIKLEIFLHRNAFSHCFDHLNESCTIQSILNVIDTLKHVQNETYTTEACSKLLNNLLSTYLLKQSYDSDEH